MIRKKCLKSSGHRSLPKPQASWQRIEQESKGRAVKNQSTGRFDDGPQREREKARPPCPGRDPAGRPEGRLSLCALPPAPTDSGALSVAVEPPPTGVAPSQEAEPATPPPLRLGPACPTAVLGRSARPACPALAPGRCSTGRATLCCLGVCCVCVSPTSAPWILGLCPPPAAGGRGPPGVHSAPAHRSPSPGWGQSAEPHGPARLASASLPQVPSSPASISSRAGASAWPCGPSCCWPCSATHWCC